MTETLTAARNYLAAGFSLFPLAYRTKDPKRNLLPLVDGVHTWKPFQVERPTEDQVKSWFGGAICNIALVMGQVSGGVIAIDFDVEEAYLAWVKKYPQLGPDCTATAETGKGYHVLVRMPAPLPRSWKITYTGQHIGETRGEGGYIAVWPSIHPSGRQYIWITPPWEKICSVNSLAELGLSRAVEENKPQRFENPLRFNEQQPNGKHSLPPRTLAFMQTGALGQSARGVNDELYHAAVQHAAAGYSPDETLSALMPAAEKFYIGTGDGNTESQARRTILSGWKGGEGKQPITLGQSSGAAARQPHGPKQQQGSGSPGHPEGVEAGEIGAASNGGPALAGDDGGPNEPSQNGLKPKYSLRGDWIIYTYYTTNKGDVEPKEQHIPFYGQITKKLTVYSETGQTVTYTIEGKKDGLPYTAEVEAKDFAKGATLFTKLLDQLPGGAPPDIEHTLIPRLGTAIAAISKRRKIIELKAITSTGWTPDGKAFVMPAGVVGQSNYICKLDDNMSKELASFGFRKNALPENKIALKALQDLMLIYRADVIHTLLGHVFLPPLLRWLGDEARYLYHIYGETGSFKTILATLMMALYGPTGSEAIVYKWTNTPYGADSRAYSLKDCMMLIDDLKPGTIPPDVLPKWVAFIQAAVDAQGRKRAGQGGHAGVTLPPRALLLSTGEAVPEAGEASYTARMLLGQLAPQPQEKNEQGEWVRKRNPKLDEIKDRAFLFSGLMGSYIEWLIAGDGCGALAKFKEFQNTSIATEHARLSSNYAANSTGYATFLKFCNATGLLSDDEASLMELGHAACIHQVVANTGKKVKDERYSQKFIRILQDAISTGHAIISDHPGTEGRYIGWKDEECLYLVSGTISVINHWLRSVSREIINIPMKELARQMYHDGLIKSTPKRIELGEFDLSKRNPSTGNTHRVFAVYLTRLFEPIED